MKMKRSSVMDMERRSFGSALTRALCHCLAAFALALLLPLPESIVMRRPPIIWTAQAQRDESNRTENVADSARVLEPRKPIKRDISPREVHQYQIALNKDQYLRVTAEGQDIEISVAIYDPGNQALAEFDCHRCEWLPISVIASVSGVYRFEVRAKDTNATSGHYEINIEEIRQAVAQDQSRVIAARVFAEAEQLKVEPKIESHRQAIRKYTEALNYWRVVKDRRAEVYTLRVIGQVYQVLGEYQKALTYYHEALALSRHSHDSRGEIAALNDIGYLYVSFGDNQRALEIATRALKLNRAAHSSPGEAQALFTIGESYYGFGNLHKALEYYQQALQLWRQSNNYQRQAQVLVSFGYTYIELSEIAKASDAYQEALSLSRMACDRRWEAITLRAQGNLQTKLGEHQQALNLFHQSLEIFQTLDDPLSKATVLAGIGYAYDGLSDKQRALEYYNQALAIFRAINTRWGEAEAEMYIGGIYYSLGENQQALDHYHLALSLFRALDMPRYEGQTLRDMGLVYASLGDKTKAINYYRQSLSLNRAGQDQRYEAYTLNYMGRIYEGSGEIKKALSYYRQALPLNRMAADPSGEALTLYNIAHAERDSGNLTEARTQIDAALSIAESLRTKVASEGLRATYFASAHQYYGLDIDVLMRLHKEHPTEGYDAVAFDTSERARARALLETLKDARADIRQGADPALLERERSLQQALNAKAERQMQLLAGQHNEEEKASLAKEIDQITTEYDEVKARIKATSPRYAALTQPQPLGLNEIQQQVLDDETLLLEYALGDERSYLWAVTRDSITSYELPGRTEIEEASRHVYDLLLAHQPIKGEALGQRQARVAASDEQYWKQAAHLSRIVLGPVAGQLRNKRLLIVADGALQYVPFGALTVPEVSQAGRERQTQEAAAAFSDSRDDLKPLMLDHEIVNLPSASTLAVLRRETAQRAPAPNTVAVLADPVFERDDPRIPSEFRAQASDTAEQREAAHTEVAELHRAVRDAGALGDGGSIPRLLASREEAKAIMQVTPTGAGLNAIGFDASRATATSTELSKYRIVHFATHGLLNNEHPELSGVILSLVDQQGQPVNGFLRLHDIYNLNLPADLVVLSACNTGLGKDVRGEGLIGLTRGFMYAGASGVMASLWKVDDEATAELMKHFYSGMLKDGLPPAAALRQAQVTMWKRKQWRSPYYWAAFVLQGEYRERIDTRDHTQASTGKIVAAGAMVLVLSIGGLYAVKRKRRNAMQTSAL